VRDCTCDMLVFGLGHLHKHHMYLRFICCNAVRELTVTFK